jgi:hypothetical protein
MARSAGRRSKLFWTCRLHSSNRTAEKPHAVALVGEDGACRADRITIAGEFAKRFLRAAVAQAMHMEMLRFIIVRDCDAAFDVTTRLWRKHAAMALVVRGGGPRFHVPRPADVLGVISKEHVADAVAAGVGAYAR